MNHILKINKHENTGEFCNIAAAKIFKIFWAR